MLVQNQKFFMTHECFEDIIEAINNSTTIEKLLNCVTNVTFVKMVSYHHFAAMGAFDFGGLNQYHDYNIPQIILDYLDKHIKHKDICTVRATLITGQFMWLSDMEHDPYIVQTENSKLIRECLKHVGGDGLCIPLYGPNNRNGFMFINIGQSKKDCKSVIPFQIQALAQQLHIRYCFILEKFHKTVKLTQREAEVLGLIGLGKTNTDIGDILSISPNTVGGYVKQIFLKLEVSDRVSAAMRSQTIKIVI